ncbi:MAG: tyrosine-type recombinase/integrase, partial [Ignavibacteriota bacterium]
MYLIKTKRSPFYQIAYLNDLGKKTSISTGKKTKADALKFLSEFKSELKLESENKSIPILLSDFRVEYLDLVRHKLSAKYVKSIEVTFYQFEAYAGKIFLADIDFRKAEKFINSVYENSKFMAAANYRILKSAFSTAVDWNYIIINPFKKFKLPKLPKSLPVFINPKQLQLIVDKTKYPIMKDIFLTAFHSGLRLSELLNLRWNMMDFENKIITLKQSENFTTKSKRERIIPMNETLLNKFVDIFLAQKNKNIDSFVFSKGKQIPINADWVSKCFKRAVRAAKLDESFHFHTLRHSFASNLIQSGVSIFVVKELLGHADISTTQIYSHIQSKNLTDAVLKLDP